MFIFIDLDDTILDFKKAEKVALQKTLMGFGIEPADETISIYSVINEGLWKKLEKTYGKCYNRNCVIMRNCEKMKIKTYERGKK